MNKQRRQISDGKRERIFAMTAGACYYCGYAATCLDHIVPYSYVANDTDDNLVPACDICNSIASNQHFDNLQAKKEYILEQRATPHWQNRLARMVVTVIQPAASGMPPAEPEPKPEPVARVSKRKKPEPVARVSSKAKPKTLKRQPASPVKAKPAPGLTHIDYLEDRPDYTTILVDDLIDYLDDLTGDDTDRLLDALMLHRKQLREDAEAQAVSKLTPDQIREYNQRPVVYGRNRHGQIERMVL